MWGRVYKIVRARAREREREREWDGKYLNGTKNIRRAQAS